MYKRQVRDGELLALVNQDALLPLDDYIDRWDEKGNIPDNIWNSVASFTPDGKTYMIPSYMNACIMWYNTKPVSYTHLLPFFC